MHCGQDPQDAIMAATDDDNRSRACTWHIGRRREGEDRAEESTHLSTMKATRPETMGASSKGETAGIPSQPTWDKDMGTGGILS